MKTKIALGCIFIFALLYRFWVDFNGDFLPGINGGYYPLQVRCILESGKLGFPDFPLLFYLDATIVKSLTFIGFEQSDDLILVVVKSVDSISLPLILFMIYPLIKNKTNPFTAVLIMAFVLFSFTPLHLISEIQKNTLAIVFTFGSITQLLHFSLYQKYKHLIYSTLYFILTALTHFGTFQFLLVFTVFYILLVGRKKAILPALLIATSGLVIVALFDFSRFERIFSIRELFGRPIFMGGFMPPPEIIQLLIAYLFIWKGFRLLRVTNLNFIEKSLISASLYTLIVFAFPLLSDQFIHRFSLFYFIPETLILLISIRYYAASLIEKVSISLFIGLSILATIGMPMQTIMSAGAFRELNELKPYITKDPHKTLIVTKHGWEWWTAWVLHTDVAQEKGLVEGSSKKYSLVFALREIKKKKMNFGMPSFPEVSCQKNDQRIFTGKHISLDEINKTEHIGKGKPPF